MNPESEYLERLAIPPSDILESLGLQQDTFRKIARYTEDLKHEDELDCLINEGYPQAQSIEMIEAQNGR